MYACVKKRTLAPGVALTIIAAGANPSMPADLPSHDDNDDDGDGDDDDVRSRGGINLGGGGDEAEVAQRQAHVSSIFAHASSGKARRHSQTPFITSTGFADENIRRHSFVDGIHHGDGGGGEFQGVPGGSLRSTGGFPVSSDEGEPIFFEPSRNAEITFEIVYNDFHDECDVSGSCTRPLCVAARSLSNPACCGVLLRGGATLRHHCFLQQPKSDRRATFVDHFPVEVAESEFCRLSEAMAASPQALALAAASANVFETVAKMQPFGFRPADIDWKTNNHARYPADFRAAAKEVLMLLHCGQVNGAPVDGGGGAGGGGESAETEKNGDDGTQGMLGIFRRLPTGCRQRVAEAVVCNLSKSTVWGMMPGEFWDWNTLGGDSRRNGPSLKESASGGDMYAIFDTI